VDSGTIAERFDRTAREYDARRGCFIPRYDDFYGTVVGFIARSFPAPRSILDLGAGTGLLSRYLLRHYACAEFTLVDVSAGMLDLARDRFRGLPNFRFEGSDYSKGLPEGDFDMIASALSIHHLPEEDKASLYGHAFACLPEKGLFVNFDQFDSGSPLIEEKLESWWLDYIERSGLPEDEYAKWLERRSLDRENSVEKTLALLAEAGFCDIECVYRFMKFAVIVALKG
jgi:tRNA (cmo5U34)-methyltransferase